MLIMAILFGRQSKLNSVSGSLWMRLMLPESLKFSKKLLAIETLGAGLTNLSADSHAAVNRNYYKHISICFCVTARGSASAFSTAVFLSEAPASGFCLSVSTPFFSDSG